MCVAQLCITGEAAGGREALRATLREARTAEVGTGEIEGTEELLLEHDDVLILVSMLLVQLREVLPQGGRPLCHFFFFFFGNFFPDDAFFAKNEPDAGLLPAFHLGQR